MFNKKSYLLYTLAILGIASFLWVLPSINFNAGGSILESRKQVEAKVNNTANMLGFSMDSLFLSIMREQHPDFLEKILEREESLSISDVNESGEHVQTWRTIVGSKLGTEGPFNTLNGLFEQKGYLDFRFSNQGNLIRIYNNKNRTNPIFVQGNDVENVSSYIIEDVLGYDLDLYEIYNQTESEFPDSEKSNESLSIRDNSNINGESLILNWKKKAGLKENIPDFLSLSLSPKVREFNESGLFKTEFGFGISEFYAKNEFEPEQLDESANRDFQEISSILFICLLIILIISVLIVGIQNISRGKVEWGRTAFIFGSITLGIFGWNSLFLMEYYTDFIQGSTTLITYLNVVLQSLAIGLFAALAYISWEALARSQNHLQLTIVDATWKRKILVKGVGSGLVYGYLFGAIMIGLFAGIIFSQNLFIYQYDSLQGFTEVGNRFSVLTLNMNIWTTVWLVVLAQVAFVYAIIHHWIKQRHISFILSVIFIGLFTTLLGRMIGTNGTIFQDLLAYTAISSVIVYAYRNFGILTASTAWWFFVTVYTAIPYWNSPSFEIEFLFWFQVLVLALPLTFAWLCMHYGLDEAEIGSYIPEYQERITQHLRVEREIEIARESQYKLMPLQAPQAEGIDVFGFFLPSFEVGGDYFDYVLTKDEKGKPTALTMVVVDVSGKAMRAAMPAVFTSGLLLSRIKEDLPAEILTRVSEPIFNRTDKRTFITCAMARLDLDSKNISVANAGHCKPILKRNGKAEFIQTPEPHFPLGLRPDIEYKSQDFKLKKGDFFLLYSDGLPEAVNEKGERFGFDEVPRLIESLDTDTLTAAEIAQEIKRRVQKFSNYQLADDTTVICLKL